MRHLLRAGVIMDVKQFLQNNLFLFKNLTNTEIDKLLSFEGINIKQFNQGEILQSNKTPCNIGVLVEGKAVIKSGNNGVIIRKLVKNDVYGAAGLFDTPTHLTSVVAVTDCTVITMNKNYIKKCIQENEKVSFNYIEFLAKKVSFLNKKINTYTAKCAEDKLYAYLLQISNNNEVKLTVDMSTIAKMLGIGRASLYRAFDKLEQAGIIIKNDKIIFLNEV